MSLPRYGPASQFGGRIGNPVGPVKTLSDRSIERSKVVQLKKGSPRRSMVYGWYLRDPSKGSCGVPQPQWFVMANQGLVLAHTMMSKPAVGRDKVR